ncbi:low-affinity phosphate transporter, partial [Cladochytrium tenue]
MADRPSMGDGEEQPLLHAQSDEIGGQQATDAAIMTFFAEALDEQLDKVVEFYVSKEKELFAEVDELELEVADFFEAQNPGRGLEVPHQTDSALAVVVEDGADAPLVAEPLGSPRAGSPSRDGRRSGSPLRWQGLTARRSSTLSTSSSILTIESTTAAAPLAPYHGRRGGSWKIAPDAKVWVRWLRRRLTACFVTLSELEDYRELNRNGFAKILKKFDKVTGLALRDGYMSGRVEQARPFTGEVGDALRARADRVVELYARVAAGGDAAVAARELVARLRDHVAIERNTVWRDMVERERRTASVVVRPRGETARAAAAPPFRTVRIGKAVVQLPPLPPPRVLAFLVLSALFAWAVAVPLFEPVEQHYCLVILVFASALWAFE